MDKISQAELTAKAASYLRMAGLRVLDTEWTHGHGRLAVVGAERNSLVAVIVSARNRPNDVPNIVKQQGRRLAVAWMTSHGVCFDQVRVDYVAVVPNGHGYDIDHTRGIA